MFSKDKANSEMKSKSISRNYFSGKEPVSDFVLLLAMSYEQRSFSFGDGIGASVWLLSELKGTQFDAKQQGPEKSKKHQICRHPSDVRCVRAIPLAWGRTAL
jgi:hypothetical protein